MRTEDAQVLSLTVDHPIMYPQRWDTVVGITIHATGARGGILPIRLNEYVHGDAHWVSGDTTDSIFRAEVKVPDPGETDAPWWDESWDVRANIVAGSYPGSLNVPDAIRWQRVANDPAGTAPCTAVPVLPAGSVDRSGPCLLAFTLSHRTAPAGTTLTATARFADASGIQGTPGVWLMPPNGSDPRLEPKFVIMARVSGTDRDGVYRGSLVLPAAPLGQWFVELGSLYDVRNNFNRDQLPAPFANTVTITPAITVSTAALRVSLARPVGQPTIGDPIALRGSVRTATGGPVAGAAVDLYGRRAGTTTTSRLATVRTGNDGIYTHYRNISGATVYTAALPGNTSSVTAPVTLTPRIRINLAAPTGGRTVTSPTTFRGTLTPGTAGLTVAVDVRTASGWKQLAAVRTGSGGAFSVRPALPLGGKDYRLRSSRTPALPGALNALSLNVVRALPRPAPTTAPVAFSAPQVIVDDFLCTDRGTTDGAFHSYEINVTYQLVSGSTVTNVTRAGWADRVLYQSAGRRVFATQTLLADPSRDRWSSAGSSLIAVDTSGRSHEVALPNYSVGFAGC